MWFILVAIISFIFKRRNMKRSRVDTRNNINTPNDRKLYYVLAYFIIFEFIQANIRTSIQYQFIKYLLFYVIFLNNATLQKSSFPIFYIKNKSYLVYWVINGIRDTLFFVKFLALTAIFNLFKFVINLISIFIKVAFEFRNNLKGIRKITITERLSTPEKFDFGRSKNSNPSFNTNNNDYAINTSKLENIENLNQMQAQLKTNLNTQTYVKPIQKEEESKLIDKEINSKLEELELIRYELRMRKFKLLELAAKLEEY